MEATSILNVNVNIEAVSQSVGCSIGCLGVHAQE
jgi:hypothetical protein